MIIKSKHAKIINVEACKLNGSLEIVTKPCALFSKSPNHGGPPPNFLDSDASIRYVKVHLEGGE